MGSSSTTPAGPSGRALAFAMIGWAGLAACLAMVYLAMRAVMDIGGSCAEGGPYVISQTCPEGSTLALLLGIFGGLGFAFLASVGGFGVGGFWAATPILAWAGLFGSLGWNFLEYGVFSPPEGEIVWGWAIPGVMFWLMAFVPLLGLIPVMRGAGPVAGARRTGDTGGPRTSSGGPEVTVLSGPGQPARRPIVVNMSGHPTVSADGRTITTSTTVIGGDMPDGMRAELESMAARINEATASGTPEENREELAAIAADFGAAIGVAMAETPLDPVARDVELGIPGAGGAPGTGDGPGPEFTEGTQALLDRLERLADMRDRGLLEPGEYETAKATIMAELEGRS